MVVFNFFTNEKLYFWHSFCQVNMTWGRLNLNRIGAEIGYRE